MLSLATDGERQRRLARRRTQIERDSLDAQAGFVDRARLTAAERLQYKGYLRCEESNATIAARPGAPRP
jgi:hypothetical protein